MDDKQLKPYMIINEQYLTIRKIGQGGFGVVWRAYDFSLRNFVAIKELLKEYSEPKYVEMFYKEALIAKNIIHDNIVRVQHFWQGSNGSFYISMDYIAGNDLEHLISKCNKLNIKIPWELAVLICGGVLKAIDYANRLAKDTITGKPYGIVYRDISPGNVMISFDGNIKLSDFGIAKTADDLSEGIKQRIVTGKYAYMSPEQINGDPDIDHRSDIFSIGLVLYEMLTGHQLYSGETKDIKEQVLNQKFDPAKLDGLKLPDELVEAVAKSLEKNKESRYEKAIEMFRDLRRLLKGKETEELTQDLANFLARIEVEELNDENEVMEWVKNLNMQDVRSNPSTIKVNCKDFIVGSQQTVPEPEPLATAQPAPAVIPVQAPPPPPVPAPAEPEKNIEKTAKTEPRAIVSSQPKMQAKPAPSPVQPPKPSRPAHEPDARPKVEEKGKTVFEEVGDWLVTQFKVYKMMIKRGLLALAIAAVLFVVLDTIFHLTPMGKAIYSKLYPPDIVIETVPRGASITMKSRDGKPVLTDADTMQPVELRKVQPDTYVLVAEKEGFKKVERVVKIEEQAKGQKTQQRIVINFDFTLSINSDPVGAGVFIDGNKFNVTPCKAELVAGEHTVKLSMKGFEELGSLAKEVKDGQCNIDFTKPSQGEIFTGVDSRYWSYEIKTVNGETMFNITGHLFKKYSIDSVPKNMVVHIDGESRPRGNTPLSVPLKAGEYKMRFQDPDGRFEESVRNIAVTSDSEPNINVIMNKWVTLRVRSKDHPEEAFMTKVHVSGNGINISKDISTAKPIRLALPLATYKITFDGDNEYKTLLFKAVNIAEKSLIVGEMEYENARLKLVVKDDASDRPVADAYVWLASQLAGKTDAQGVWERDIKQGTTTVRIIAKGYVEKSMDYEVKNANRDEVVMRLVSDQPAIPAASTSTVTAPIVPGTGPAPAPPRQYQPLTTPAAPAVEQKRAVPAPASSNILPPAPQQPAGESNDVVTCANCGKKYPVGTRRPRFCTNCGKPFKY